MLDVGARSEGDFSEGGGIDWNLAPTDGGNAAFGNDLRGDGFDGRGLRWISSREEEDADGEVSGIGKRMAQLFSGFRKQRERDLGEDAGAVAGLHVGIDSTTVRHAANRGKRMVENGETALALQVCDGPHAAVIVFLGKPVEGARDERCAGVIERIHRCDRVLRISSAHSGIAFQCPERAGNKRHVGRTAKQELCRACRPLALEQTRIDLKRSLESPDPDLSLNHRNSWLMERFQSSAKYPFSKSFNVVLARNNKLFTADTESPNTTAISS